ncbi:MAG TPA: universal stress protein [Vicinamibacterales bacterium]|nr:universal stress protein [Vicinamibacterales bacterium]
MSYAALMVHVDATPGSGRRTRLAADLAARFQSALIGIAGRAYLPGLSADRSAAGAKQNDSERAMMMKLLADIEKKFRAATAEVGQVEWRGIFDYPNKLVPLEARAADLLIVGRRERPGDLYFALDPGMMLLQAGRPVLVVPDNLDSLAARRVVVAWKDTRESRRAIRDALPFLQGAKEVMIVEVSEQGTDAQGKRRIDDVADYLIRHKVVVAAKTRLHTKRRVADELLRFARNEKADLVVAGGYGHVRLSEWIFGGVTRDLLAESPICCLFAH